MERYAVPEDFQKYAGETIKNLKLRYGVGDKVISRWRTEIGRKIGCGRRKACGDSESEIITCLNCKKPQCTGYCEHFQKW